MLCLPQECMSTLLSRLHNANFLVATGYEFTKPQLLELRGYIAEVWQQGGKCATPYIIRAALKP